MNVERLRPWDQRLVAAAKHVHILGSLAWPIDVVHDFVERWERGSPRLPSVAKPQPVDTSLRAELEVVAGLGDDDPWTCLLRETANSYLGACEIIEHAGTSRGSQASRDLYGSPRDRLLGSEFTHVDAAKLLLGTTLSLVDATSDTTVDICIPAEAVATEMRAAFGKLFGEHAPTVELDPNLASKAAASAERIRLRAGTCFHEDDIGQLIQHEAFVHSATAKNGLAQPHLTTLSLSAPRTTATQEGLATLAELRSGVMDLARLRRLALRVVAIDMALEGADFVEVFRYFHEAGQTVLESALSTARVFRGGDVAGRHAFTKDVVYLRGLFAVHTFCRQAIARDRPHLIGRLFVGRLTLSDALRLEPLFLDGTIAPARYVPDWAANTRSLAAYLSFSAVLNRIDFGTVDFYAM